MLIHFLVVLLPFEKRALLPHTPAHYRGEQGAIANFVQQKIHGCEWTMRFAFEKNRFHTSERTQSNQTKQRKQTIMVHFVESVKSILEVANSLCLIQICILCLPFVLQPLLNRDQNSNISLKLPLNLQAKEFETSKR